MLPVSIIFIMSATLPICVVSTAVCCLSFVSDFTGGASDGDVFIVMSRNRRIVRMFSFDNRSYSLFEKEFVAGYQFMKVERNGADIVYRIDWKDVVLILETPVVKILKIR